MPEPKKKVRLNLEIPERTKARLEAVRELSESETITEVIRRAITVYETLLLQQSQGNKILIRNNTGDRELFLT